MSSPVIPPPPPSYRVSGGGQIRPPALVYEYLASGSLKSAIARKAEFLKSDSIRIKLALDTARVRGGGGDMAGQ